jgi:hypothetical protein
MQPECKLRLLAYIKLTIVILYDNIVTVRGNNLGLECRVLPEGKRRNTC